MGGGGGGGGGGSGGGGGGGACGGGRPITRSACPEGEQDRWALLGEQAERVSIHRKAGTRWKS